MANTDREIRNIVTFILTLTDRVFDVNPREGVDRLIQSEEGGRIVREAKGPYADTVEAVFDAWSSEETSDLKTELVPVFEVFSPAEHVLIAKRAIMNWFVSSRDDDEANDILTVFGALKEAGYDPAQELNSEDRDFQDELNTLKEKSKSFVAHEPVKTLLEEMLDMEDSKEVAEQILDMSTSHVKSANKGLAKLDSRAKIINALKRSGGNEKAAARLIIDGRV